MSMKKPLSRAAGRGVTKRSCGYRRGLEPSAGPGVTTGDPYSYSRVAKCVSSIPAYGHVNNREVSRMVTYGHSVSQAHWTGGQPMTTLMYMKPGRPKTPDPEHLTGGFLQPSNGTIQSRVNPECLSKAEAPERLPGAGKGRKTKLAAMGLSPSIIKSGDPRYAAALYQANKYRKTRMKELAQLHGHVSSGAGALLASASLALAASRFLYERYAEGPELGGGELELLKQASGLADKARAAELAAWEMSAREGVLKRRSEASNAGMPWIQKLDGDDKAKSGRKTNAERQERVLLNVAPEVVGSGERWSDE